MDKYLINMFQNIVSTYAYAKKHQVKSYLRYQDRFILIPEWEAFCEYIEFALSIFPFQSNNRTLPPGIKADDTTSSTELAKFVCMINQKTTHYKRQNNENKLRGDGMHNMAAEHIIPTLFDNKRFA